MSAVLVLRVRFFQYLDLALWKIALHLDSAYDFWPAFGRLKSVVRYSEPAVRSFVLSFFFFPRARFGKEPSCCCCSCPLDVFKVFLGGPRQMRRYFWRVRFVPSCASSSVVKQLEGPIRKTWHWRKAPQSIFLSLLFLSRFYECWRSHYIKIASRAVGMSVGLEIYRSSWMN